jgi:hypothetical protein
MAIILTKGGKGRHMNARSIRQRLLKVERKIGPRDDGTCTLEELCRAMWQEDKCRFREIAKGSSLTLFVRQFEIDEAARAEGERRMRPRE